MLKMASSSSHADVSLHVLDYIVFCSMFLLTIVIGMGYAVKGKNSNSRETYFVGDRNMHLLPVAVSLLVTFESSIMMLGLPTEVYVYGVSILIRAIGKFLVHMLTAHTAVPLFKPLGIICVYEYLQLRFKSRCVTICVMFLNTIGMMIYMGIVMFALAVALEVSVGINRWISILAVDVCAVIYTSLGGIKSVVWTDVFQALVMLTGVVAIIVKGTIDSGGTSVVLERAWNGKRLDMFNFDLDPTVRHNSWNLFFTALVIATENFFLQASVQRIASARTDQDARRMLYIRSVLYLAFFLLVTYEGLVIYAYLGQEAMEPITCGLIKNPNQIVPYAVLHMFKDIPGVSGLFLASVFSASLSTVSSGLNGLSVFITQDTVFRSLFRNMSEVKVTLFAKASVVVFGIGNIFFCFFISFVEGTFQQIVNSVVPATTAPVFGLFLMAAFFPSTHAKGASFGLLVGLIVSVLMTMGGNFGANVKQTPFLPLGQGEGGCHGNNSNVSDFSFLEHFNASFVKYDEVGKGSNITTDNNNTVRKNYSSVFDVHDDKMILHPFNNTVDAAVVEVAAASAVVVLPQYDNNNDSISTNLTTDSNQIEDDKSQDYNLFFSMSYLLFQPIGMIITVLVGVLASIKGRNKPGDVNPKLFLEISESLLIFLPPFVRRWLKGFGPQYKDGWKGTKTMLQSQECDGEREKEELKRNDSCTV